MLDGAGSSIAIRRCALAALLAVACATAAGAPPAGASPTEIAWHAAASHAEVDRAFAAARAAGKPVFVAIVPQQLAGTRANVPAKDAGRANCTRLLQAG